MTRAIRAHNAAVDVNIAELIVLPVKLTARKVIRGDVAKLTELAGELKVGFVGQASSASDNDAILCGRN